LTRKLPSPASLIQIQGLGFGWVGGSGIAKETGRPSCYVQEKLQ
jgi:hypothetical protein